MRDEVNDLYNGCIEGSEAGDSYAVHFRERVAQMVAQLKEWQAGSFEDVSASDFERVRGAYFDLCDSLRVTSYNRELKPEEEAMVRFCAHLAIRFDVWGVAPLPDLNRAARARFWVGAEKRTESEIERLDL